jgi:4-amino-4-deoxy-L-arabinose transferase-like glycosyltransferase
MDGRHRHSVPAGWRLSLVIPAYNEAAGIRQAIAEAAEALARFTSDFEILVVDDASRDDTAALVAEAAQSTDRVRLLRHDVNRGYGAALRTGFDAARFDLVAFTDADCQFHLDDLQLLLPLTERQPIAVGYRLDRKDPWRRRFFSWGYNTLARSLMGTRVRDCDCALKVFRKDALARLSPETSGFFVNTEMLTRARQLDLGIAEVGVRHRPRVRGTSTVALRDIPRTLRALLPFWWSRVLFAGAAPATVGGTRIEEERLPGLGPVFILFLLAALLFFSRLTCPLLEPDEARYAEIPRQMLTEGRLLVPVLHGQPYYDKPPLLYWLVMGSYALFGVHDWAARIVPGFAGFLTVVLTYAWGRKTLGERGGLVGAFILCLSARYVYLARMLTMDSLLCLCVVAALAAAHAALSAPRLRRQWWLVSALACGCGVLAKGPVALVLAALPVGGVAFLDPRVARVTPRHVVGYGLAAIAVAAPWYVAVSILDPDFLGHFFWKHNVLRYVAPFDHAEPFWFYVPSLFLGMLPWTLLLPPLVRLLCRRSVRSAARRPAALGFFLLSALGSLLFFSLSGSKRPGYVLPAMPPLALALACYLTAAVRAERWRWLGAWLPRAGTVLAQRGTLLVCLTGVGGSVVAVAAHLIDPALGLVFALLAALCGWALHRGRLPTRVNLSWPLCVAATFALLFAGVHTLLPAYARKFSLRGQVRAHAELAQDAGVPVACYPRRWDSVSFYLQRNDVRVYGPELRQRLLADARSENGILLFVKTGRALEDFLAALPDSFEFMPRGRQGQITAGWLQRRREAPPFLVAHR